MYIWVICDKSTRIAEHPFVYCTLLSLSTRVYIILYVELFLSISNISVRELSTCFNKAPSAVPLQRHDVPSSLYIIIHIACVYYIIISVYYINHVSPNLYGVRIIIYIKHIIIVEIKLRICLYFIYYYYYYMKKQVGERWRRQLPLSGLAVAPTVCAARAFRCSRPIFAPPPPQTRMVDTGHHNISYNNIVITVFYKTLKLGLYKQHIVMPYLKKINT